MLQLKNKLTLLFLLLSLIIAVASLENRLSLYGKADSLEKPIEINPLQIKNLTRYEHTNPNFELQYNQDIWQLTKEQNSNALIDIKFTTQYKNFSTVELSIFKTEKTKNQFDKIIENFIDQGNQKLVSKELTKINNLSAWKLNFSENFLNQASEFTEYYLENSGYLYRFVVRNFLFSDLSGEIDQLINSLTLFDKATDIKGIFSQNQKESSYETETLAELVKPSVVNIVQLKCIKIINKNQRSKYLKSKYNFCAAGKGTGMFITSDGQIGTNGHVLNIYPEQSLVEQVLPETQYIFVEDIIKEMAYLNSNNEVTDSKIQELIKTLQTSPTALNALTKIVLGLVQKEELIIENDVIKYYVQLGKTPINIDIKKLNRQEIDQVIKLDPGILEAEKVTVNFPNRYSPEYILENKSTQGTDVAIIKVKNSSDYLFPRVTLGKGFLLKTGMPITIIGFPSLVEGKQNALIAYDTAVIEPTVSKGIISALKRDNSDRLLIQTDASIEKGNSGGPGFNQYAEVIGIVTFGVQGSLGNFNFLRDIEDLKLLMTQNKIVPGDNPVFIDWKDGLEFFENGYYTKALKKLNKVQKMYPVHPLVEHYITNAKNAIENGKDKGLFIRIEKDLWIRGIIYSTLFMVVVRFIFKMFKGSILNGDKISFTS